MAPEAINAPELLGFRDGTIHRSLASHATKLAASPDGAAQACLRRLLVPLLTAPAPPHIPEKLRNLPHPRGAVRGSEFAASGAVEAILQKPWAKLEPGGPGSGCEPKVEPLTSDLRGVLPQLPNVETRFPTVTARLPRVTVPFPGATAKFPGATAGFLGATAGFPDATELSPGATARLPAVQTRLPGATTQFPSATARFPVAARHSPGVTGRHSRAHPRFPSVTHEFWATKKRSTAQIATGSRVPLDLPLDPGPENRFNWVI